MLVLPVALALRLLPLAMPALFVPAALIFPLPLARLGLAPLLLLPLALTFGVLALAVLPLLLPCLFAAPLVLAALLGDLALLLSLLALPVVLLASLLFPLLSARLVLLPALVRLPVLLLVPIVIVAAPGEGTGGRQQQGQAESAEKGAFGHVVRWRWKEGAKAVLRGKSPLIEWLNGEKVPVRLMAPEMQKGSELMQIKRISQEKTNLSIGVHLVEIHKI